ncbi:MAG: HAD family hydrolase [Bacteroidota bacterium]
MNYKGVIFDLDGTLLNTLDDLSESANKVLKKHHLMQHSREDFKRFIGSGARKLIESMLPEDKREDSFIDQLLLEFKTEYGMNCDNKTVPFPGIISLVNLLHEGGIKMTVLSNKPHELTLKCCQSFLPVDMFEEIMGQKEGKPRKPDPTTALELAKRMELEPEEIIFLGDSENDINTALAGGFFPVGVTWGMRTRKQLEDCGTKTIIGMPDELLAFIFP